MARKRQIDPIYPLEKEIASMSIPARYFYLMSWCHMDDTNGVMPHDTFLLKGQIFPADNVDVELLIQECIKTCRLFPFKSDGKSWLWCPTLKKHQIINNPSRQKYPDPPIALQQDYRSGKLVLPLSRVELSRVEKEAKAEPSAALKAALDKVYKNKFNIYALMNQLKKESKVAAIIPEEVLLRVCSSYWRNKPKVKEAWPWFKRAVAAEWQAWNAQQQIKEDAAWKQASMPQSIREILGIK